MEEGHLDAVEVTTTHEQAMVEGQTACLRGNLGERLFCILCS